MELMQNFEGKQVEIIELNGQILFNARNVAECLGMSYSIVRRYISSMSEKQAVKVTNSDVQFMHIRKLNNAGESFLTESGVYKLALRSKKPEAEKFSDWVCDEVLPSIRQTGMYATEETAKKLLADPAFAIKTFTKLLNLEEENKALQEENARQNAQFLIAGPKAQYCDIILRCPGTVRTTDIAQDYGVCAQWFNKLLWKLGIQYKRGDHWNLTALYAGYGYAKVESIVKYHKDGTPFDVQHMYWTQGGRKFLYEFLKEKGFYPVCEGGDKQDIMNFIKGVKEEAF